MSDETQAPETTSTTPAPETAPAPTTTEAAAPDKPLPAREALQAAAKKLSGEPPGKPPAAKTQEPAKTGPGRDASGRFASGQKPAETTPEKPLEAPQTAQEPAKEPEPQKPSAPAFRGPQSWSPAAR